MLVIERASAEMPASKVSTDYCNRNVLETLSDTPKGSQLLDAVYRIGFDNALFLVK
jgi:hypothetical protein